MSTGEERPDQEVRPGDVALLKSAHEVLEGSSARSGVGRLLPFLGPAFIACVAYIDPGNFATNIQGGSQFGYLLLWVVLGSNAMAMLVQTLSAKLGIATGRNLAELCRENFPTWAVVSMWLLGEFVAMATDLAEFIGAAVGFELLFHIPLMAGALLTGVTTMVILALDRRGFRAIEAVITALVGVIAVCYVVEIFMARPDWLKVGQGLVIPRFDGKDSVVLAVGILGATVMPHVIFLHSALTQGRIVTRDPAQLHRLCRFEVVDVAVAMGLAGFVNCAMLIMAAATFHAHGLTTIAKIEDGHQTLTLLLGGGASFVFAISLLASGLSSSTVGTMAGQVIMQGFIHRRVSVWVRRLVTMLPSLICIAAGCDPTKCLVYSQVALSFGLPFAIVPLVMFTRRRDLMGPVVNHRATTAAAIVCAVIIVVLNSYLVYQGIHDMIYPGA
jgi:manganese transport protein